MTDVAAKRQSVEVGELIGDELAALELQVVSDAAGLNNAIEHPRIQKPGLAIAGYYDYIRDGRLQILGASEINYARTLGPELLAERIDAITRRRIPAFVISKGLPPVDFLVEACDRRNIPILSSPRLTSQLIGDLSDFLEEHLVPSIALHAVMLEVLGLGVLLIGDSGVGKSECALDLITRGHSLVADDRVIVRRYPHNELGAGGDPATGHHMELRGLGILNVRDLFGLAAVRERKRIDLVVELVHWRDGEEYDRLGLDETTHEILETSVPYLKMPVALGRNVAILVEIAARNHRLKLQGHHSAREFIQHLKSLSADRAEEEE